MKDLIDDKNRLLLMLEANKCQHQPPGDVQQLASQIAELEAKIAKQLLETGEQEKTAVNLVSQASCLIDAGRSIDAIAVYRSAMACVSRPNFRQWIETQIEMIQASDSYN